MTQHENVIFDITNEKNIYKGVLFAELDHIEAAKKLNCPYPAPTSDYIVGILALIWVDENGVWNAKMRLKFPSGNKQVISKKYEEEHKENIHMNETYVLNHLYEMPMKNKSWHKNKSGTPQGILDILEDTDMIESSTRVENE